MELPVVQVNEPVQLDVIVGPPAATTGVTIYTGIAVNGGFEDANDDRLMQVTSTVNLSRLHNRYYPTDGSVTVAATAALAGIHNTDGDEDRTWAVDRTIAAVDATGALILAVDVACQGSLDLSFIEELWGLYHYTSGKIPNSIFLAFSYQVTVKQPLLVLSP